MRIPWPEPLQRLGARASAAIDLVWWRYFRTWVLTLYGLFPFTKTGLAFLALFVGAVWLYGVLVRDLVLLVAGLAGAVIIILLLLCTLIGAAVLYPRTRKAATPGELDLDTGIPQPTGYRLVAPRFIPFIVADWVWAGDRSGTEARVELERDGRYLVELASPYRRCIVTKVIRRFSVRDVFGLTQITWRRSEPVMLRVLPYRGMLAQMPPPAGMAEGDDLSDPYAEPKGDRVEMRQYAPGDPLRMVLWKVFARSGKMMVRTPERSVAERKRGCAYLVTGEDDDATAAAARVAIERGLLGEDWILAADGVDKEANDHREEAFEVIARSGEAKPEDRAARLATFLGRREYEGYQFCLLFVPPGQAAWDAIASQNAATATMRVQILTAASDVVPDREPARGIKERAARFLLDRSEPGAVSLSEIRERASALRGLATELIIAERNTGRTVNDMLGYKG